MTLMDECMVCGEIFSLSELEQMGYQGFNELVHLQRPIFRLVKYFPNTTNAKGENYSVEALSNNTVYLNDAENFDDCFDCAVDLEWTSFYEKRIKKYCQYFNVEYDNIAIEDLPYKIALKLYEYGTALNAIDHIDKSLDEIQKLNLKHFIYTAFIAGQKSSEWVGAIVEHIKEEYREFQELIKHFKIACFTTSPYLNRMWANSCNKGFCIEYEIDCNSELYTNLFPVIYSQKRNDFTLLSEHCDQKPSMDDLWQIYFNGLLRKSLHWVDQQEWRLIQYESDKMAKSIPFFKIKKVYLGNKMSAAERLNIIDICKKKGIPYVGIVRKPNSFDLVDCDGDCLTCQQSQVALSTEY